jgi:transposase
MIQVDFSEKDIETFKYLRTHHPHPRIQQRMDVLWLKSNGLAHHLIAKLAGVCENTVTEYLRMYNEGGIDKLKELNFYKPQSELSQYSSTLESYFKENPPASIKEAASKIEEITGLKRSETQARNFLESIGLKRLKVGTIPSKADLKEQENFKNEELEPRLEEAKSGERKVCFVDAAHFVLSPFLGYLWVLNRIFIKAPSGRKRFNVLGALDAITHELITVTNDTYINAYSFCELLWDISHRYCDVPITLVLDNARYQKCALVFYFAKLLDIELLYLPAYSPNLNLIERLWKFVKKKCLYSILNTMIILMCLKKVLLIAWTRLILNIKRSWIPCSLSGFKLLKKNRSQYQINKIKKYQS